MEATRDFVEETTDQGTLVTKMDPARRLVKHSPAQRSEKCSGTCTEERKPRGLPEAVSSLLVVSLDACRGCQGSGGLGHGPASKLKANRRQPRIVVTDSPA